MMLSFPFTHEGIFLERKNRFSISVFIKEKGHLHAYLPNPGRLEEILLYGTRVYLLENPLKGIGYTAIAAERNGKPLLLHTHYTNQVAQFLIEKELIHFFSGFKIKKREINVGNVRFDFLLTNGKEDLFLEVKSCTLFGRNIAFFPDAETRRGKKHLLALENLTKEGQRGAILFIVHNPNLDYFMPEYHLDFEFSKALIRTKDSIIIKAISVGWEIVRERIRLLPSVKELQIPWQILEREAKDRGVYIVILRLEKKEKIRIGSLGEIEFEPGYYTYVGSAKKNLEKRIRRHKNLRKRLFWHIDFLRERTTIIRTIPIRSSDTTECELAESLKEISSSFIEGFGSSDCKCRSHLFFMEENPLVSADFLRVIQYFKMDRIKTPIS